MLARLLIRAQLLMLVLAVVLPASGLIAYALHERLSEARRVAQQQLQTLARETAGRFEVVLQRRVDFMSHLVARPKMRALDAQQCDVIFGEIRSLQPDFLTLELRKPDGELLCAAQPDALAADAVRALPWFSAGLANGRFTVGGPHKLPPGDAWALMLTQPVRDAAGEVGGLLILAIDLPKQQQQTLPVLPDDTLVVVFDRELRTLMRSPGAARWIGQPLPAPQRAGLPARLGEPFELTGVDGVTRLNVGASVPTSGWQVHAAMPVERVYAGYHALLWRSLAGGAAALLLVGLLAWRIGAHIARPIHALTAAAAAAAGGRAAPTSGGGSSEVAAVAADLQRLADQREQLRGQHARLSASHAQLTSAARDIVLLVDADDRIVEANDAALAAYGYSADELRAMTVSELRAPQARRQVERDRAAAAGPRGALFETVHQRKDGSTMPVEVSARQLVVEGRPCFQSFIRDISARKRDEALLRGQSAVLALVAQGAPLADSLAALARLVQAQAPELLATVLLLDDDGVHLRHGAAPGLPPEFIAAIDGSAIGAAAGSCGAAAYRRAPVISEDIASDPAWAEWRAPALALGLRACWSTPILDAAGQVLGTFAMYFRQPGRPDAAHQRLVDLITYTAAIAIVGARSARTQRAQLDELLRWQALTVDREERMLALKAEVDALRTRVGEPARYTEAGEPARHGGAGAP